MLDLTLVDPLVNKIIEAVDAGRPSNYEFIQSLRDTDRYREFYKEVLKFDQRYPLVERSVSWYDSSTDLANELRIYINAKYAELENNND